MSPTSTTITTTSAAASAPAAADDPHSYRVDRDRLERRVRLTRRQRVARNAIGHASLLKVALRTRRRHRAPVFSHEIDVETKVTNQHESGRCWLFAYVNMLRIKMIRKHRLEPTFELSPTYLFFWDQLEKANRFLHNIWELRAEALTDYHTRTMLREPVEDGGDWNIVRALVEKYGVVPKEAMHESYQVRHTEVFTMMLNSRLRMFAKELREGAGSSAHAALPTRRIRAMVEEVYRLLCIFFGEPPRRVQWERYVTERKKRSKRRKRKKNDRHDDDDDDDDDGSDGSSGSDSDHSGSDSDHSSDDEDDRGSSDDGSSDGSSDDGSSDDDGGDRRHHHHVRRHAHGGRRRTRRQQKRRRKERKKRRRRLRSFEVSAELTPLQFFDRYVTSAYVRKFRCLMHYPGRPTNRWYAVRYSSTVVGEPDGPMLNVSMRDLKRLAMRSIDRGYPVYFAADVVRDASTKRGILDPSAFDFASMIGFRPFAWRRRADAVAYRDCEVSHAMLLRGYHLPTGRRHLPTGRRLPTRWLVENSWGGDAGHDGNFVMTDAWFTKHVYNISAHLRASDRRVVEADRHAVTVLEPYDLFGSLS
jgi:bleomycin hydrolase